MKVTFDGMEITLEQDAYVSNNGLTYQAMGTCNDAEYMVFWDVIDNESYDQSNACDWGRVAYIEYQGEA